MPCVYYSYLVLVRGGCLGSTNEDLVDGWKDLNILAGATSRGGGQIFLGASNAMIECQVPGSLVLARRYVRRAARHLACVTKVTAYYPSLP